MYELFEVMVSLKSYLWWIIVFVFGIWVGTITNVWNTRSILREITSLNLNISSYLRKQEQQTGTTTAMGTTGTGGTGPIPTVEPVVKIIERNKNCENCQYPVASTESVCPSCQKPPFANTKSKR
jgi:hypothetical protein